MKNSWIKVFGFTFRKAAGGRGYIATTIVVALILLLAIPGLMLLVDNMESDESVDIGRVVMVGADEEAVHVLGALYSAAGFECAADIDAAAAVCEGDAAAVIALVEDGLISVILPDDCGVDMDDANEMSVYLAAAYPYVLSAMSGDADALEMPVQTAAGDAEKEDSGEEMVRELIGMLAPYAVVMPMYFMVLIYGQSVANSAIMEKTSKLMDLFLVSVRPAHMMLGKTLAMAAAGIIQILAWVLSAVGGCALGVYIVKLINPETTLAVITVFESIGGVASMFEPASLALTALVIIAGFMVYCALAGIGGALASKPEDLGSANYLFTLALIASFFVCLFSGESPGMISDAEWMAYVPFTAVMVMPGRLLMGTAGIIQALTSVAICASAAVLLCIIAGKIYAAMAFYRGKAVNPLKLLSGKLNGK